MKINSLLLDKRRKMLNFILMIYLIASIFVASIALKLERKLFDFFVISIVLTPIVGGIILILLGKQKSENEKIVT